MKEAVKIFNFVGGQKAGGDEHERPKENNKLYTGASAPSYGSQFHSLEPKSEYAELKRLIVQAGLLKKAPAACHEPWTYCIHG
jgi:hypothetical protein